MKEKIPAPIMEKVIKLIICILGMLIFGLVWGIVVKDRIMLILTSVLAAAGGIKIFSILKIGKKKQYEVIEGTVVDVKNLHPGKRQRIAFKDLEDNILWFRFPGRHRWKTYNQYRIYFQKKIGSEPLAGLPEWINEEINILGVEVIMEEQQRIENGADD